MTELPLLSLLIWIPILGGIATLVLGIRHPVRARFIGLITAMLSLALCIPLYLGFDTNTYQLQFVEKLAWIKAYDIYYALGVDGLSLPMVILTTFTTLVVILASWQAIRKNVAQYLATFLIMQGIMVGIFTAVDSMLFYFFWESVLIPMYLCIGMWGGSNRTYASIKFFLYTFLGSLLMLVALLYMRLKCGSFNVLDFYELPLTMLEQILIFIAFFAAFAVKVPMWPVHTWLPDAHTEAPAGGSVVLAALMLKMGVYGFFRFSMPITPDACQHLVWLMIGLSLIAIVYIGLVAIVQIDMKRLVAYSSVAHMGFATLGAFMIYVIIGRDHNIADAYMSIEGAMVQMVSHAFSTGAMFFGIGILYDKLHSRSITDYGGVVNRMPIFTTFFLIAALANIGLPGTSGFVGEFMIILSSFKASFWVAFTAAMTLILSASYTLWMVKRVFFGEIKSDTIAALTDIHFSEIIVFSLLTGMILLLGVYPESLLKLLHASVGHLLELSIHSKLL